MANYFKGNKELAQNDIILVEWLDAVSIDDWSEYTETLTFDPAQCFTVGVLIKFDAKVGITLAANFDSQNDKYSCIMVIPSGMILKVKKLGKVR